MASRQCGSGFKSRFWIAGLAINLLISGSLHAQDAKLVSRPLNAPVPWDFQDGFSSKPLISADDSTVILTSTSTDLLPDRLLNDDPKPYLWEAETNQLRLVGVEPNSGVALQSITADGKWVGVISNATNLVPGPEFGTPPAPSSLRGTAYLLNTESGGYIKVADDARHLLVAPNGSRVAVARPNEPGGVDHLYIYELSENSSQDSFVGAAVDITPNADGFARPEEFSSDGKYLAFISDASNLVEPPISTEVERSTQRGYLYELETATTTLLTPDALPFSISMTAGAAEIVFVIFRGDLVNDGGPPANGRDNHVVVLNRITGVFQHFIPRRFADEARNVVVSADGNWASFETDESLSADDTDLRDDSYLWNRRSGEFTLLRPEPFRRASAPEVSKSGALVAFTASRDSYLYSVASEEYSRISKINGFPVSWGANRNSNLPSISGDGGVVSFASPATNLVSETPSSGFSTGYLFDTNAETTAAIGGTLPRVLRSSEVRHRISDDARYVVYAGTDGLRQNLRVIDVSLRQETELLKAFFMPDFDISRDGRYVVAAAVVTAAEPSVYLFDLVQGTQRVLLPEVSIRATEVRVSEDGNTVLFKSTNQDLVENYPEPERVRGEYFVWQRDDNRIELLGASGLSSIVEPAVSDDAQLVFFSTDECYLYNRAVGALSRVFVDSRSQCEQPALSQDNRFLVFGSRAANLVDVPNDARHHRLYVLDRVTDDVALLTPHAATDPVDAISSVPVISADGSTIAFESSLESLAPDGNQLTDVFVVPNPLFQAAASGELVFTATLRANSRTIDLEAAWPPEAQWTQVRELFVPGGVLWDGPERQWSGEYTVPDGVERVLFNSRYWVAGTEFGSTDIEVRLPAEPTDPPNPTDPTGLFVDGFVWNDDDGDGRRDDEEPGEVGRDITLYRCEAPWGIAGTATSEAPLGTWQIPGLSAGSYQIGTRSSGVEFSPVANDNLIYPNGFSNCFALDASGATIGMGLLTSSEDRVELGGFAWFDSSFDGVRNVDELPAQGKEIAAYRCESPWGVVGQAVTDSAGNFSIPGVLPGEYQFGFDVSNSTIAPRGADNRFFANGFTNCIRFDGEQSAAKTGLGIAP